MTDTSPFTTLPTELRLLIYEFLFQNTGCYLQIYKHHIHLCRYFSHCPPLPLLLTNKTISKEVQDVLYESTRFDVQLHMQHLPLVSHQQCPKPAATSGPLVEGLPTKVTGCKQYKYGFMPALQLPIKMQTFLRRVQRLQLNVWIYDAGKAEEMVEQIEAFRYSLQQQQSKGEEEEEEEERPRLLKELEIRLRLRPRWMQKDCEPMVQGEVDALVHALQDIACVGNNKTVGWLVEREVRGLISPSCWARVLEGRVTGII